MAEPDSGNPTPEEAEVRRGRRISTVWAVPVLALAVGAWLAFTTLRDMGPEIEVVFATASGLEAGKTQVKYKDVVIGKVSAVRLDPETRRITVTAKMDKTAEPLLTETTRFWVVRPRLAVKGISGLGTLVSGAYVELDPGEGGAEARKFTGLEDPPVVRAGSQGLEILLVADDLGSLSRGSPIYFRGIEAGEVTGFELAEDARRVNVHAFVHAPFDGLVRTSSRFWNISGFEFGLGAEGVKVGTGTLQSLIMGGIAFETPESLDGGKKAQSGARFDLFATRDAVTETGYTETASFILYFDSSVRGLTVGAPVEFRGLRVGKVLDIRLEFDPATTEAFIPVLIDIELGRVSLLDDRVFGAGLSMAERKVHLDRLVARGLRARLKTGNFLTRQMFVDLDLLPETPVHVAGRSDTHLEIPTLPQQLEEISNSVTDLVAKLQRIPFDTISARLVSTLDGIDRVVNSTDVADALARLKGASKSLQSAMARIDETLVPGAAGTLKRADAAIRTAEKAMTSADKVFRSVDSMVSDESALRYETQTAIKEIAAAARAIRQFTEYLQRNPNALLTGKSPR